MVKEFGTHETIVKPEYVCTLGLDVKILLQSY